MKRCYYLFLLIATSVAYGQTPADSTAMKQAVVNLYKQYLMFPQELIYLQTDRPCYVSGEKVFFRTFIQDAALQKSAYLSRYLYVELIAPVDTVLLRQQIRLSDDQMFYGALSLPENLPQGNYRIRAYTRYMESIGESAFYNRTVFIADPQSAKTSLETHCTWTKNNEFTVRLRFVATATQNVKIPKSVDLQLNGAKKIVTVSPNDEGWMEAAFKLDDSETRRLLLVKYLDEQTTFAQYLNIPYRNTLPEVSFYPEGGNLIAEQSGRIAFKALTPDGTAADITGSVFNAQGEKLLDFATEHEGMGVFSLLPQKGQKYYAEITADNREFRVNLPEIQAAVATLQTTWEEDSLSVRVLQAPELPTQDYYLLLYRQGIPFVLEKWNNKSLKVAKKQFKTGVSHVVLLSDKWQIISERLVFINKDDAPEVTVQPDKTTCRPREQVNLQIALPQAERDTIPANFAIAVTDDKDVKLDTTTHIRAEILLSAELLGQINQPAAYFRSDAQTARFADLLMMTHGWRRYFVAEALQENFQKPKVQPEVSQKLSGKLETPTGKPAKQGLIQMKVVGDTFSEVVEADEQGRYFFYEFEYPDSTAYFFLANTAKKTTEINIIPDEISYPTVAQTWNYRNETLLDADWLQYIQKADNKYIMEHGARVIALPGITVTARKKDKKQRYDNNTIITSERWVSPEDILEFPPVSFDDLFTRLPGVFETQADGSPLVRGKAPLFVVNGGQPMKWDDFSTSYSVHDFAQVELFTEAVHTLMFSSEASAVIVLTTWKPGMNRADENKYLLTVVPLGYQLPVAFYSPQYDTPAARQNPSPDLRSLIYWRPNVVMNEENKASISFYTADAKTTYSVVIEGVKNKELIYKRAEQAIEVQP